MATTNPLGRRPAPVPVPALVAVPVPSSSGRSSGRGSDSGSPVAFALPSPLLIPAVVPPQLPLSSSTPSLMPVLTLRSPRISALNLAAGTGVATAAGGIRPSPSHQGMGTPLMKPVARVDSDDRLYSTAVSWEVDPEELEYSSSAKIGAGSHGEVFKAKWRGTPVAVKQLLDPGSSAIVEMRHEIAVLAHMHHPRVVQFLGACTKGKPWLILSEYLRGGSVAAVLERLHGERLEPFVAARWALDMAQGLRYLHEHKPLPVVHRDLKPQNLLIDGSGHVKISDFGLAKVVDQLKALDEKYVMTGETGSYRYMAPEVFRHEPYGAAVDIYAFGVILFQLTSPSAAPPMQWLSAVAAAEAMSLQNERPEISPKLNMRLRNLIARCWDPDASKRPSAAACCAELEAIYPQQEDAGVAEMARMSMEAALSKEPWKEAVQKKACAVA